MNHTTISNTNGRRHYHWFLLVSSFWSVFEENHLLTSPTNHNPLRLHRCVSPEVRTGNRQTVPLRVTPTFPSRWSRYNRLLPCRSRHSSTGRNASSTTTNQDTLVCCRCKIVQKWYRVCGAYVMGGRPDWVSGDESREKSLDHLTRFKTDEPYLLFRKYPCFATSYDDTQSRTSNHQHPECYRYTWFLGSNTQSHVYSV